MENKLLNAALWYREKMDFSVIPLSPGSKVPPKGFEVLPFRDRLATAEEIRTWWKENPKYNVGIITGKLSNLFVVDHDKYKHEYSSDISLEYIPDNVITASASSPQGGEHQYFKFAGTEGITIKAGFAPAMDYRGEGGYVVAPPSVNGNGDPYAWIDGLSIATVEIADIPSSFINKIINTLYMGKGKGISQDITGITNHNIWEDGKRDDNLFHVAHCLVLTKNDEEYIRQTLSAIMFSWGEVDEKWIGVKIQSAIGRAERKERNIQAEVDAFIGITDGNFSITECHTALQTITREEKQAVRMALHRRKDKTIEKAGLKDGVYRRIDTQVTHIDFSIDQGAASPVLLPLGLHELVNICEGNIILLSGEYNSGKTTAALTSLQLNKNRMMIRYISSEMRAGEFRSRWRTFGMGEDFWMPDEMTQYVELNNNLPALILPDALNIIDYLEFRDGDYTQGAEYMRQIHDKLNRGVAIVCNQQKEGARLPRSGDLIMEKPRLAVTFRKVATDNEEVLGIAEIQKAKNVRLGKADGKKLKYQIMDNGSRFRILINWGWWKK